MWIGAEGLSFQNGRDLLLADDTPSFAEAILLLLRDAQVRRRFEQAAVQLAAQLDWSVVAGQFAEVLQGMVKAGSRGARMPSPVVVDR